MDNQAFRTERDTLGPVQVPASRLWGAQTQRSLENFSIGTERIPQEIIQAFAQLKKASASANCELGRLDSRRCEKIG